jgi:hypothetical protein
VLRALEDVDIPTDRPEKEACEQASERAADDHGVAREWVRLVFHGQLLFVRFGAGRAGLELRQVKVSLML